MLFFYIFFVWLSLPLIAEEKLINYENELHAVSVVPSNISAMMQAEFDGAVAKKSGCEERFAAELIRLRKDKDASEKRYQAARDLHEKNHPEIRDWKNPVNLTPEIIALEKQFERAHDADFEIKKQVRQCESDYVRMIKVEEDIEVFREPDGKSEKLGKIRMLYAPTGWIGWDAEIPAIFKADFINTKGEKKDFPLDFRFIEFEFLWIFHTTLAQKGSWFKLPKEPFPHPVWVNLPDRKAKNLYSSNPFNLKTKSFTGDVLLEKIENGMYLGRKYEEGDQCKGSEKKIVRVKIPITELYDQNQHLVGTPLGNFDCDGE